MIDRAANAPRSIVLAEGSDPRVIKAAIRAQADGVAHITLLGRSKDIRPHLRLAGDKDDRVQILDPMAENTRYVEAYYALQQHKAISYEDARTALRNPLNYANIMVYLGEADGSVAGAVHSTGDVVRSALQIHGTHAAYKLASSFFIMLMPDNHPSLSGGIIYADCGLVIEPSAQNLADIAAAAADNGRNLLGLEPKIAMLSFSTLGSANHPAADKPRRASALLKAARPDLQVDGEMQFDTAIIPSIAARKAPQSHVAGHANIFIFPDLNSGNIAYKITERLGGASAIGPILQGLSKPANDLSRGSDVDAIYNMIVVTVLQAQELKL